MGKKKKTDAIFPRGRRLCRLESLEQRNLLSGDLVQVCLPEQSADAASVQETTAVGVDARLLGTELDTDRDGTVTPADALRVLNHLDRPDAEYARAMDVDYDGVVSPLDPLVVINRLHRWEQQRSEAVQQATEDLAQRLIVSPQEIQLESATDIGWQNSALGLGYGISLQMVTPGFKILLRSHDDLFEYRSAAGRSNYGPVLALKHVALAPGRPSVIAPRESNATEQAWKARQVEAAVEDLSGLLRVPPEQIEVVSVESVRFADYGRGMGRGTYAAVPVDGFRIVLGFERLDTPFEYRAVDSPVLVLSDLPEMR